MVTEKVIWISAAVEAQPGKRNDTPTVLEPVAVHVREVGRSDVSPVAYVTPHLSRHQRDVTIEVVTLDGVLYRSVLPDWNTDATDAESIFSCRRQSDNPLRAVANRRSRNTYLPEPNSGRVLDGQVLEQVRRDLASKAKDLLIVDDKPYARCHEPTWVVRRVPYVGGGFVVQPFLGEPGKQIDAVWFAFDRVDLAVEFGKALAESDGVNFEGPRGAIDPCPGYFPMFEDSSAAEDRVVDAVARSIRLVGGNLNEDFMSSVTSVLSRKDDDKPGAMIAAKQFVSYVETLDTPSTRAFMDAISLPCRQVALFRSQDLSEVDESALDDMLISRA